MKMWNTFGFSIGTHLAIGAAMHPFGHDALPPAPQYILLQTISESKPPFVGHTRVQKKKAPRTAKSIPKKHRSENQAIPEAVLEKPVQTLFSESQLLERPTPLKAHKVALSYPALAKQLGIEGNVVLKVIIQPDGGVKEVELLEGIGFGCDEEALHAMSQFRFTPPKSKDGQPVEAVIQHTFRFRLF